MASKIDEALFVLHFHINSAPWKSVFKDFYVPAYLFSVLKIREMIIDSTLTATLLLFFSLGPPERILDYD